MIIINFDFNKLQHKYKNKIKFIGLFLTFFCFIFVFKELVKLVTKFGLLNLINSLPRDILVFSLLVEIILLFYSVYIFKLILELKIKEKFKFSKVANVYLKSNIFKYLPGNFMHFVSRNAYATHYNYNQKKLAYSTLGEIVLLIITKTFFVIIIYLMLYNFHIIAVIAFFLIFFVFWYKNKKISYIILNIFIGTFISNYVFTILYVTYYNANFSYYFTQFCFVNTLAWLVGYLTPGAPGGIGVKEAVIIALTPELKSTQIALIAILHRIILILADIIAWLSVVLINKFFFSRKVESNDISK
ncbi:MAG: hypothetical protein JG764_1621 [Clostridiales bacterium]|nr:hypothetical protein [Clostridiales bacterium]